MTTIQGEGHIFKRFDDEMRNLHDMVLRMGELSITQLREALQTLEQEDPETAYTVISNDARLNALDIEADDEIIRLIARRQPMARDLRELIAVGKVVSELERAGDEARKIAGLTIRFFEAGEKPPSEEILRDIFYLAEYVIDMLELAIRAFDELDLAIARKVLKKGLKMDNHLQAILRRMTTFIMEDSRNIGHFIELVLGIRALERYGNHAKNIAGHIVFIESGEDVRHNGVEAVIESIERRNREN